MVARGDGGDTSDVVCGVEGDEGEGEWEEGGMKRRRTGRRNHTCSGCLLFLISAIALLRRDEEGDGETSSEMMKQFEERLACYKGNSPYTQPLEQGKRVE